MKALEKNDFSIRFINLSNGEHHFEFAINDSLFNLFEYSLLDNVDALAQVKLLRSDTMLEVSIALSGQMMLESDRSLRQFVYPFEANQKVIYKFGEGEDNDDIKFIAPKADEINIVDQLYDLINLVVPLKKLHPDEIDQELINIVEDNPKEEKEIDPRWAALKKLKE